ncbi:hypothetical protein CDAR_382351 [Caerostris darwini]|uniref:Uncharacterized protein n=1 Tax=Caerostris darwini TaxID=1538125 RepID=A0AAV4VYG9_9ARAC|nr:hypothetical protein CDAR_382351 [Caerostris darwini]
MLPSRFKLTTTSDIVSYARKSVNPTTQNSSSSWWNCRVGEIVLKFGLERSNVNQSRCLDKALKRIDRRHVTFLYTKERGRQTRVIDELVKRDLTRLTRGHAELIAPFAQSPRGRKMALLKDAGISSSWALCIFQSAAAGYLSVQLDVVLRFLGGFQVHLLMQVRHMSFAFTTAPFTACQFCKLSLQSL